MIKPLLYWISCIILITLGCTDKKTDSAFVYDITLSDASGVIDADSYIDSIFIVHLETNPEIIISGIKKLLFHT